MNIKILEGLPLGVSLQILEAVQKISIPVTKHKESIWSGFHILLNTTYPLTLEDGDIIDGVMMGCNGSKCYLIREKNNGSN
jgi:hypothetical protein